MTVPRPRRPGPSHPSWCVSHDEAGRHRSHALQVGDKHRAGSVTASLAQDRQGPPRVVVGVAQMVGIVAWLQPGEAALLGRWLVELAERAEGSSTAGE